MHKLLSLNTVSPAPSNLAAYRSAVTLVVEEIAGRCSKLLDYLARIAATEDVWVLTNDLTKFPHALETFLVSETALDSARYLTKEGMAWIGSLWVGHDFGKPGDSLQAIKTKMAGFKRELAHVTSVDRVAEGFITAAKSLDSDRTGDLHTHVEPARQIIIRQLSDHLRAHPAQVSLLRLFVHFHDLGKFGPAVAEDGTNDYGIHPKHGETLLERFFASSRLFEARLLPDVLKLVGAAHLQSMVMGIQVGHLVVAAPCLGENSNLVFHELVGNPALREVFSHPELRRHFLMTLALTNVMDVGSYSPGMCPASHKVMFYINSVSTLDALITTMANEPRVQRHWHKEDAIMWVRQFDTHALDRIARLLTANFSQCAEQLQESVKADFVVLVSQHDTALMTRISAFFATSLKLEYFRHFFQLLLLKDRKNNTAYSGLNAEGLQFLAAWVAYIFEIREQAVGAGHLHPNGLVVIRTGAINCQTSHPNSLRFYDEVVAVPAAWEAFFCHHESGMSQDGHFRIYFRDHRLLMS